MNYSTDVKFSSDLIKNGKTTITYSGSLFRTGSESVTIVYGFGDNWEHTTEKEMTKNENNFSVEIELLDFNKLNFCFKDSNNIWDNNNYLNYVAPIAEPEKDYNFIINENLVPEMLDNILAIDLATPKDQNTSEIEVENITTTTTENQIETDSNIELVEDSVVYEESFEIEIPEEDPADIQEFMGEVYDEPTLTEDLEQAFSVLDDSKDAKKEEIVNFDMDALVDEILSPVIEARNEDLTKYSSNLSLDGLDIKEGFLNMEENAAQNQSSVLEAKSEDTSNIQSESISDTTFEDVEDVEKDSEDSIFNNVSTENSLIEVKEFEHSFIVSPRSLSKFYLLRKRIKLAVYKLFTAIPKIIDSAFNTEKD